MNTNTFTWRPVTGSEVEVELHQGPGETTVHHTQLGDLGFVWRDQNPTWGWHFRRYGVREIRGSQLRDRDTAVSTLLFTLRQEGKV